MPREKITPQATSDRPRPPIGLTPVKSSQVAAVGYDHATKTLAVRFQRGSHVYHYPNVTSEQHQAFVKAESIGGHFGKHLKHLPFEKFAPESD